MYPCPGDITAVRIACSFGIPNQSKAPINCLPPNFGAS